VVSKGWAGKRLIVDLTSSEISFEDIPEAYCKKWIGGRGFNAAYLSQNLPHHTDPLSPENMICFSVGPLTGSLVPCSGWVNIASCSPLYSTPTLGETNMGGHWGPELKYAGIDQLVIKGRAKGPVYLLIDGENVEVKDASAFWMEDIQTTSIAIQSELAGKDVQVACIGPAGSNRVRYATITNSFFWKSGDNGMGAVMGSKNLKAIAIRGNHPHSSANPDKLLSICLKLRDQLAGNPLIKRLGAEGTLTFLQDLQEKGASAKKNFSTFNRSKGDEGLSLERYNRNFSHHNEACFACPVHCGRYSSIKEKEFTGTHFGGLDLEGVYSLSDRIGCNDWNQVLELNRLCLANGLSPSITGAVLAWIMNCYERGLVGLEETDGLELNWGATGSAMKLIQLITERRGIGDILAEGSYRASRKLGKGSQELAFHVKGIEHMNADPRISFCSGLSFAVNTGERDDLLGMWNPEFGIIPSEYTIPPKDGLDKAVDNAGLSDEQANRIKTTKFYEDIRCLADMLGLCSIPYAHIFAVEPEQLGALFQVCTGSSQSLSDLFEVSEKVITLERAARARQGYGKEDDFPAAYFFENEIDAGPHTDKKLEKKEWESALSLYYGLRKWNTQTGKP
jgi:aldehyde:ferredoxin oxidoreductase